MVSILYGWNGYFGKSLEHQRDRHVELASEVVYPTG